MRYRASAMSLDLPTCHNHYLIISKAKRTKAQGIEMAISNPKDNKLPFETNNNHSDIKLPVQYHKSSGVILRHFPELAPAAWHRLTPNIIFRNFKNLKNF